MTQKVNFNNLTGDTLTIGNTVITGTGLTVNGSELAGAVTSYANASLLPLTNLTAGDFAFVDANNALYFTNGSGWYLVQSVNKAPTVTLSGNNISLDGTSNGDINYTVTEPEGTPVTISVSNSGIANTSLANVQLFTSNNTVRFNKLSEDFESSDINVTISASDGVNVGVANFDVIMVPPLAPNFLRTPTTTLGSGVSYNSNAPSHTDSLLVTNSCWNVTDGKYVKFNAPNVRFGSTNSSDERIIFAIRFMVTSSARIGASFRDADGNYHIIHALNGVGGNYSTSSSWRSLNLDDNTWYIMSPRNINTTSNAWLIHNINTNTTFQRSYGGAQGYALAYSEGIGDMWFFGGDVDGLDGYTTRGEWNVEVGAVATYPANFDEVEALDDFKLRVFD